MSRYKVLVDDNFHYQDAEDRQEQGVYATLAGALAVCRGLVEILERRIPARNFRRTAV
jgi:hypothetical protein